MRTRRRIALLLASAAALGVGLIALPASAAAAPPVVPTCTPKASTGSDSCVRGTVTAINAPLGAAFEPIRLGTRVRSRLLSGERGDHEGDRPLRRRRHDQPTGDPACPAASCPARTSPRRMSNAARAPMASGQRERLPVGTGQRQRHGSTTVHRGTGACTMIFKGANSNQVVLYARAPVATVTGCNNPASNTAGSATVLFTGTLSQMPVSSPYGRSLTVPNTDAATPALDDFYATIQRGRPGEVPRRGIPAQGPGGLRLHDRPRPTRSRRRTPARRIRAP